MRSWAIDAPSSVSGAADAALAGIIASVGMSDFHQSALEELNRLVHAGSWSVYRLCANRPPVMYLSGSYRRRDTTVDCWRTYRAGLYERDGTFDHVAAASRRHGAMMCHLTAQEIPQRAHRDRIYRRYGILDRLSIVAAQPHDELLAINFYHHQEQGLFSDGEFQSLERIGQSLLAAVSRHITLAGSERSQTSAGKRPSAHAMKHALQQLRPALSEREIDVCARLLVGMTYDGIAADLGVSATTVKTYRNRAFARLGIHFRSELFALCLAARATDDAD